MGSLLIAFAFFQLSRQLFLDFSTFNRKIFRFLKFQIGKILPEKLSRQKRSGITNFQTKNFPEIKISCRTTGCDRSGNFSGERSISVVRCPLERIFPGFAAIFWEFYSTKCTKQVSGTPFLVLPVSLEVYYAKPYSN